MKKNMNGADRIIGALIALTFIGLYFGDVITGGIGITLIVVSVIFLLTSFISFCPIYAIFGISTCKVEPKS